MSQPSFSLTTDAPGTLAVSGALTFATAADALQAGRHDLDRGGQSTLDLAGVTHADSAGLATVLAWLAHARGAGKPLAVTNAPAGLLALARVSGVDTFL